jgi:hypothetical protein
MTSGVIEGHPWNVAMIHGKNSAATPASKELWCWRIEIVPAGPDTAAVRERTSVARWNCLPRATPPAELSLRGGGQYRVGGTTVRLPAIVARPSKVDGSAWVLSNVR